MFYITIVIASMTVKDIESIFILLLTGVVVVIIDAFKIK